MIRFLFRMSLGASLSLVGAAANPACAPIRDAMLKLYAIPVHIYSIENAPYTGGKPRSSEIIYLNSSSYVQVNGKWRTSKITQETLREIRNEENSKESNATCRAVREEAINGEAAVLYTVHRSGDDSVSDSRIWISKARGVPLKTETDMDVGGKLGKNHRTMRYEYTNVQAPSGLR